MRMLLALVHKDLLLHGLGVVAYSVGFPLAALGLRWLLAPLNKDAAPMTAAVPMALYFVLICAGWLVERERSRETFALLRALPISDLQIVAAKFLAYCIMQVVGFAGALVVLPVGRFVTPVQLVTVFLTMLAFGCLVLAVHMSFSGKRALVAPFVLIGVMVVAAARLAREPRLVADFSRLWGEPWVHAVVWVGALATAAGLVWVTYLRMRSQDTQDLIG